MSLSAQHVASDIAHNDIAFDTFAMQITRLI